MAAGSIVVDLLMRTGSFITDTDRAAKRLAKFEREVVDSAKRIGAGVAAIGATIAGSLAAIDRLAQGVAQFQGIGEKIGDSASRVASLQLAADKSGTALDTVASASVKLTAALSKVDEESDDVARALGALNIPIEEFRKLSPVQQLERLAKEMARFEDSAGKTAIAVALFGRAGADVIPFLKDLADAQGRASKLSDEQIAAADRFTKAMAEMRSELTELARVVIADMLPPFQAMLDYLRDGTAAGSAFASIGKLIGESFKALAVLAANVMFVFQGVGREIGAIGAQLAALARRDMQGFRAISQAVKEDAERARAELDAFERRVLAPAMRITEIGADRDPRRGRGYEPAQQLQFDPKTKPDTAPKGARKAVSELDRYIEQLRRAQQAVLDLSTEETARLDILEGRLGKITPAEQTRVIELARQVDITRSLAQAAKDAAAEVAAVAEAEDKAMREASRATQERLKQLLSGTSRARMETALADIRFLNEQFNAGAIKDVEQWAEAVREATARIADGAKQAGAELDDVQKNLAENLQSYFGEQLQKAMEGNFRGIGDAFVKMVNRMVAEAIAADLVRRLMGDSKTGQKGWVSGLIDAGIRAFSGSGAQGVQTQPGRSYWVGERGPELFVPRTAGTVVPAADPARPANKSTTINVNVGGLAGGSRQSQVQQAELIGRQVMLALNRNG